MIASGWPALRRSVEDLAARRPPVRVSVPTSGCRNFKRLFTRSPNIALHGPRRGRQAVRPADSGRRIATDVLEDIGPCHRRSCATLRRMTGNPASPFGVLPAPTRSGKVRDLYDADNHSSDLYDAGPGRLIIVASDRISAFDVVLKTPIPGKGEILTGLTLWWFQQLTDLVQNHLLTADPKEYPPPFTDRQEFRGRSMLVRELDMVMVECVGRAYLAGSGTSEYRRTGAVCGVPLPTGLTEGSLLPEPIFTPTTKGGPTGHDEPLSYAQLEAEVGKDVAAELRRLTLAILDRGRAVCEPRGILVADTKVEFGIDRRNGALTLADEVLTPDSSRFWPADQWQPGQPQPSFDKQPLRDWLETTGWDKQPPGPPLPKHVVAETRRRYLTAYERITGSDANEFSFSGNLQFGNQLHI
jgi:phosphoribosylaminoimidazole-succinocarboxamide synthase